MELANSLKGLAEQIRNLGFWCEEGKFFVGERKCLKVKVANKEVYVRNYRDGKFLATDKIPGLGMFPFGDGRWEYMLQSDDPDDNQPGFHDGQIWDEEMIPDSPEHDED